MTDLAVVVNRYAKAAIEAAKTDNLLDKFLADLKLFTDNFSTNLIKELSNPAISKADLAKIIEEFSNKLSLNDKVKNFLVVIATARRIKHVKEIYQQFLKLAKIEKNILEAEVFVANELEKSQLEAIKTMLQKKYSNKTIELKQIIKKDVLGGVMIKINSIIIDASLKNQLAEIALELESTI